MMLLLMLLASSLFAGSLNFSANATDRVNYGSGSTLDNLSTQTYLFWVYPTTLTADATRYLYHKGPGSTNYRIVYIQEPGSGAGGVAAGVNRGGAAYTDIYLQKDSLLTTNSWQFLAVTMDPASGNSVQKIYYGSLTTTVAEVTGYASQAAGSGSTGSDASDSAFLGNHGVNLDANFPGRIGFFAVYNRVLSTGEIVSLQYRPRKLSGCVLHSWPGGSGTQPDWSGNGNNGTITGATDAPGVPLGSWFAQFWRGLGGWFPAWQDVQEALA